MSTFPGAFVPVAPPADGLRLAFVAARRRRNRKAGATGAAGLLAAVAIVTSMGGGADRTLLQQEPLPPSTTGLGVLTGAGTPSTAPNDATTSESSSSVTVASAPRATVAVPAAGQPTAAGAPYGGSSSRGAARAQGTGPISGPMTRSTSLLYTGGDVMCPARKQQEGQRGLCTDLYASTSSAGPVRITAQICNVGTATEVLSFDTARELDLAVRKGGVEVWRWSLGRRFEGQPHDLAVGAQECITWETSWARVDSRGVQVPAGTYSVVADFDAKELATADRHPSYSFTLSQQP